MIGDKVRQHEMLNYNRYTTILADTSQQQRQIGTFGEFLSHNKDFYAMRSWPWSKGAPANHDDGEEGENGRKKDRQWQYMSTALPRSLVGLSIYRRPTCLKNTPVSVWVPEVLHSHHSSSDTVLLKNTVSQCIFQWVFSGIWKWNLEFLCDLENGIILYRKHVVRPYWISKQVILTHFKLNAGK